MTKSGDPIDGAIERSAVKARQGFVNGRVVTAIVVSLGLVSLMFGLALMLFNSK